MYVFCKTRQIYKKVRECDLKFLTHNKLSILGKPHTIEISSPLQYLTFKEEKNWWQVQNSDAIIFFYRNMVNFPFGFLQVCQTKCKFWKSELAKSKRVLKMRIIDKKVKKKEFHC